MGRVHTEQIWYNAIMKKDQVQSVFERACTWPEARREAAAHVLLEMEAHDASPYQLSDEHLAEVRRRRAKKNPKHVSLSEARKRFTQFGV
jgi:hypothetical protein